MRGFGVVELHRELVNDIGQEQTSLRLSLRVSLAFSAGGVTVLGEPLEILAMLESEREARGQAGTPR